MLLFQWDEVQKVLMTPKQRPVILNRSASTNTSNPFGSTFCYGVQDLIFEVNKWWPLSNLLYLDPQVQVIPPSL